MGCSGCSTGRGCGSTPKGCNNNGSCGTGGCNKLNVFDWLSGMSDQATTNSVVEVRFKNTRKDFFLVNGLKLTKGDIVATEAGSGHDIGVVSTTGELVKIQLRKKGLDEKSPELKKVYRKANEKDIDKWHQCIEKEKDSMHIARKAASKHGLKMKISDVEFQGDGTKVTLYYTAEDRVDFRELIKSLAEKIKTRIEMRQIGTRQEAGRLGGIGSCGRELCCSTWLTDFRTVSTSAAKYQQLSINPTKLAGQCGKLKCCLNYELETYMDAIKDFPSSDERLVTKKGVAFHMKTDIFKRLMWYVYEDARENFIPIPVDRVKEIVELNSKGKFPQDLKVFEKQVIVEKTVEYENVVGQDSITRFDQKKSKGKTNHRKKKKRRFGNNKKKDK
jgi:cell fate regulator YaaT (PSP1 superfamily)